MANKKQCCPPVVDDVPAWFMTFSDVITLLMTFFILLLTFASSETEKFQRMQTVMFGGGSATGVVGDRLGIHDKDAYVMRQRPLAARRTLRGSEMPPIYSDASLESVAGGLEALDQPTESDERTRYAILASLPLLVDEDGTLSPLGRRQFTQLAQQVRRLAMEATLEFSGPSWQPRVMSLREFLVTEGHVPVAQVRVASGGAPLPAPHFLRIVIDEPPGK